MKKKVLIILVAMMAMTSCQKETWDFNYPKEQLCGGWWRATHYSPSGNNWTSMSSLGERLSVRFYENGDYSATGMFSTSGSGDYTYSAIGNKIDILMDGRKLYDYTVSTLSGATMVLKMTVSSSSGTSIAYFKFERE